MINYCIFFSIRANGIPVEVEAFDIESNLVGFIPLEDIITGDPVIIGLNPNMAFKSPNL